MTSDPATVASRRSSSGHLGNPRPAAEEERAVISGESVEHRCRQLDPAHPVVQAFPGHSRDRPENSDPVGSHQRSLPERIGQRGVTSSPPEDLGIQGHHLVKAGALEKLQHPVSRCAEPNHIDRNPEQIEPPRDSFHAAMLIAKPADR